MNTLDLFRLDGKVAIVTGASRGLGTQMAIALGQAGADLVITGRVEETIKEAAKEIGAETSKDVLTVAGDITNADDMARLASTVKERFGRIDVLVNNAGMNNRKPFLEYTPEEWRQIIDTNVNGLFLCTQAIAPTMIAQKSGRIINIGSIMGTIGLPTRVPYAASKGAVHQITKTLAQELAPHGVTVNTIAPGPFMTEMNKAVIDQPDVYQFFLDRIPLGHWADPSELRGPVVFLASDASSFVTGATLYVDGGWTTH